jgi:flavin reductase (DIM6/NTAB) family NADH-FMN oxidoreductase RutF
MVADVAISSTSEALRAAFRCRPEPVCLISTLDEYGEGVGMTATGVMSVSLAPPILAVCVKATSLVASSLRAGLPFVVQFLAADQEELARRFASATEDKFRGVGHRRGATGTPRITGALATLECEVDHVHTAGDHLLVLGRVEQVSSGRTTACPLLYCDGKFHSLERAVADGR